MPPVLGGFFLLFLNQSCSQLPELSEDEESIKLSEELDDLSKKVQPINYGPLKKNDSAFIDKTNDYGLSGLEAIALNAVDLNFDGYPDLVIIPGYYSRPKFMIFHPKEKKFKLWEHDPLPADFKATFVLIYDLNNDKVPDILSGVLNQKSEVSKIPVKFYAGKMKNHLLYFHEVPEAIKLDPSATSSLSLIDYDLDGQLDLFVGNWFEQKNNQYFPSADRLLKNTSGKFEDVSQILINETKKDSNQIFPPEAKPTYGSSTCDIDQNGFPDILTASAAGYKNKLWMNLKESQTGTRKFEDVGPVSNYGSDPDGSLIATGGGRTFFSACTDYNDDGLMDIFLGELSHAYDNDSVDRSSILTGSKETYPPYFMRTEYLSDALSESWNQGDRRGVWVDYNLDGRIDLLVDNSGFPPYSRLVLFEQDETHAFTNVASPLGIDIVNPIGTIVIDLNQDGLPDIVTGQNNIRKNEIKPRLYVFENQSRIQGRRSLKIYLGGLKSNPHGLGAMVMLYQKKENRKIIQRRWVEYSQGGMMSQNEEGAHFGIDRHVEVVGIKVRWPYLQKSGFKQGEVLEKLYSTKGLFNQKMHAEITLCEDGKVLPGKMSCQF